ncbi:MAG: MoxR family ATPase [Planctomycetes bacterium]|nr:MoxR family ATPase [Planctomycetota bacterium]
MDLDSIRERAAAVRDQCAKVVVGQKVVFDLLLTALLAEGHVLLEGVPGTAKTLIARSFAASLGLKFNRIQFTPDLMPGDVTGTNLYDFENNRFHLRKGPVFTEILLADEINRTAPKTQSALLQAMQERSVSLDGEHHRLSPAFMVVATQNPIEQEGTYPLPEAQLDRFLFKVELDYPSRPEERRLVLLHGISGSSRGPETMGVEVALDREFLLAARQAVATITIREEIVDYVVDLVRATREHPSLFCGASPRAATNLIAALRARAVLDGRDYVIPDDLKQLARATLAHRVVLAPGAEIEGTTAALVVEQILEQVAAPR